MSYPGPRPITSDFGDVGLMARAKHGGVGAFPAGSVERMRRLGGALITDPVLWVCSGWVRDYPYYGVGPNDIMVDVRPEVDPTYVMDVRESLPKIQGGWRLQIFDPPYSKGLAGKYYGTEDCYPEPEALLKRMLENACPGGRVGVLDWLWTSPPDEVDGCKIQEIVAWPVTCGRNSRARLYVVDEKVLPNTWRKVTQCAPPSQVKQE